MLISNPFQMNDWNLNKLFKVILTLQIFLLAIISLETIGFNVPILREIITIPYLLFIPGVLILRIMRLHKLGDIETLLFGAGLSISSIMFIGFIMNTICPFFGIKNPFTLINLMIFFGVFILILCILAYLRDNDFEDSHLIEIDFTSPIFLALTIIPFLSIFGTYLMNCYDINVLIIIQIILISIIPILVTFDKIPKKLYPYAVFISAISLVYFTSLISSHVWGNDIQIEYYLADLVIKNSFWNPAIGHNYNGTLSIVILAPIFSIISGLKLVWVFKIVYPFLYSLVPIGLYRIFQKQTSPKIAFLGVFYFIATFSFYTEMLALARQQIAEIFFVLLILLIFTNYIGKKRLSILFIIFSLSIAVSHYSLAYIYMIYAVLAFIVYLMVKNKYFVAVFNKIFGSFKNSLIPNLKSLNLKQTINPVLILLFIIFTIVWYRYAGDSVLNSSLSSGTAIISTSITNSANIADKTYSQGLYILLNSYPWMHQITKIFHMLTILFSVIGIIVASLKLLKTKFENEFIVYSLIAVFISILAVTVPYFSAQLQTTRFYHINQLILSPFFIVGFIWILKKFIIKKDFNYYKKIVAGFLVIFLLFNSGLVYYFAGESGNSASLISFDPNFDFPRFNNEEISSAQWLISKRTNNTIYADQYRKVLLGSFGLKNITNFDFKNSESLKNTESLNLDLIKENEYLYLGTTNVMKNTLLIAYYNGVDYEFKDVNITIFVSKRSNIYDNGGSTIYL